MPDLHLGWDSSTVLLVRKGNIMADETRESLLQELAEGESMNDVLVTSAKFKILDQQQEKQ